MDNRHLHKWIEDNNFLKCSCGKKKLLLNNIKDTNVMLGTKSNGQSYKVRSNRDRIFYPDEWDMFYSQLSENHKYTFKFLALTGARINEARHIKVEDIDFPNQRIILRVTKRRHGDNIINKSKTRTLRVSRELLKMVKKRISLKKLKREDYINILSQPASHIAMKKALKKSHIKDWEMLSIHSIRKTSENWALSIGIDSMKLSTRFGHNMMTQYEHYSQSDAFNQREKMWIRSFFGDTFI